MASKDYRMSAYKLLLKYEEEYHMPRRCIACGEPISDEKKDMTTWEYVRTKRGSDVFIHTRCIEGGMGFT